MWSSSNVKQITLAKDRQIRECHCVCDIHSFIRSDARKWDGTISIGLPSFFRSDATVFTFAWNRDRDHHMRKPCAACLALHRTSLSDVLSSLDVGVDCCQCHAAWAWHKTQEWLCARAGIESRTTWAGCSVLGGLSPNCEEVIMVEMQSSDARAAHYSDPLAWMLDAN